MNHIHTRLFLGLSIATALLSCGAFIFFFKIIENKNEHASAVETTLQNKMKEKENTTLLEKKVADVNRTHALVSNLLVNPAKVDAYVQYLETLGAENSTSLEVKKFEPSTEEPHIILVSVSIKGGFASIMQTLALLENSPYKIWITNAYLNKEIKQAAPDPKNISTGPSLWQADISFTILSSQ